MILDIKRMKDTFCHKCKVFGIETVNQKLLFWAQIIHESAGLTQLSENLYYSTNGLLKTFPKYFKNASAARLYAGNPEKIANRVYANRLGNGDEASGDGYLYRGGGLIQVTGKDNYKPLATYFDTPVNKVPDMIRTDVVLAMLASLKWWYDNKVYLLTDIDQVSKRVNGGTIGIEQRRKIYKEHAPLLMDIAGINEDENRIIKLSELLKL